jgi:hypothetical protein
LVISRYLKLICHQAINPHLAGGGGNGMVGTFRVHPIHKKARPTLATSPTDVKFRAGKHRGLLFWAVWTPSKAPVVAHFCRIPTDRDLIAPNPSLTGAMGIERLYIKAPTAHPQPKNLAWLIT